MKPRSAYQWGLDHNSCYPALRERKALGPDATQADWYKVCDNSGWLIWQFKNGLSELELESILQSLLNAVNDIVARAVRTRALTHESTEKWAQDWLDGKPRARTVEAAWAAAGATETAAWASEREARTAEAAVRAVRAVRAAALTVRAAGAADLKLQADDIRRHIPEWPGKL